MPHNRRTHRLPLILAALPAALLLLCPGAAAEDCIPRVQHENPIVDETGVWDYVPQVSHHNPFVDEACATADYLGSGQAVEDLNEQVPHVQYVHPLP